MNNMRILQLELEEATEEKDNLLKLQEEQTE